MKFHIAILIVFIHVASGQHTLHSNHPSDGKGQIIEQSRSIASQKTQLASDQQDQVPIRWRSASISTSGSNDSQKTNVHSTIETKYSSSLNQNSEINTQIEMKHEELRRRTIRMRLLTNQQNDLRKQLEFNETTLSDQLRGAKLENLDIRNIQMLVGSVRNCMRGWERLQNELQKLYRDQIFEEKKLLELYQTSRPNDRDIHNQLSKAVERWELIYGQLLEMQMSEQKKNKERERKYENLLIELDTAHQKAASTFVAKSPDYYSSTFSRTVPTNIESSKLNQKSQQHNIENSQIVQSARPIDVASSYQSSYDWTKKTNYSYSNRKSSSEQQQQQNYPQVYYSSSQSVSKMSDSRQPNYPLLSETSKISPDLQENSLIFRRPESSSLKDPKCLDKWFDDLAKEDAEWIAKNQLKNEELFKELVRLQKLQWDTLLIQHNEKKLKSIPQKFECEYETKSLCDQEEANFRRRLHEYRLDRYPSNIDQQQQQNQNTYTGGQQPLVNQQRQQQTYQKIQKFN